MRLGIAGDVHGNLHALDTILAALDAAGCDRIACPGDLVGYGPRPNECVARLRAAGAVAVAGNHDLMALDRLPSDRLPDLQRQTIDWTRAALDDATREYLGSLPLETEPAAGVVMTHGALGDPTVYVHGIAAARSQLAFLTAAHPHAGMLVLGHTHRPQLVPHRAGPPEIEGDGDVELPSDIGPWLVNAGSVGQAREPDPVARAVVLDLDRGRARFLALEYDVAATRRELAAAGLPAEACHLPPHRQPRRRRLLGWLGRAARASAERERAG
ncbi:MAG TPA: metallophosphoesterase family protein [Thermoleophilaceae bacterium]